MRKFIFCAALTASAASINAQILPGSQTGNYTGVHGVYFNPSSIADNKFKWNVNILSLNAGVGNSHASYSLKTVKELISDGGTDSLFSNLGNSKINGMVNVDYFGPSFMFGVGKKSSIAITSRVRAIANVHEIDGSIIDAVENESDGLPFTINSNRNQKLVGNAWADLGASYARVVMDKGPHFLKAGITVKYVLGVSNTFIGMNNIRATIDEDTQGDVYATNASGTINIGVGGLDFDAIDAEEAVKFNSTGFAADLGVTYEYRKNGRYIVKAGLSLNDIGSIKYEPNPDQFGSYAVNISAGQRWYPGDLDDKSVEEIKQYLDGSPYFTNLSTSLSSYKASLPTHLLANVDWAVSKHFFVDLLGQFNLIGEDNAYSSFYRNSVAVTPRFESRIFSAFLPLSYNSVSQFNAGFAVRVGPLFFGSGSVITALIGESKQADFHVGIRFGGLRK